MTSSSLQLTPKLIKFQKEMKSIFPNMNMEAASTPKLNLSTKPLVGCQSFFIGKKSDPHPIARISALNTILSVVSSSNLRSISQKRSSLSFFPFNSNTAEVAVQKKLHKIVMDHRILSVRFKDIKNAFRQ